MKSNKPRLSLKAILCRALFLILLLVSCILFYLSTAGFPVWLCDAVIEEASSGDFAFESSSIRLHRLRNIVFSDIRIYKKRVVGPALVDAGKVVVSLDLLAPVSKRSLVNKVKIHDGIVRPGMAVGGSVAKSKGSVSDMDILAELDNCLVLGARFNNVSCRISAKKDILRVGDIKGSILGDDVSEGFTGEVSYDANSSELSGSLITLFDFNLIAPVFEESQMLYVAELLRRFEFSDALPRLEIGFKHGGGEAGDFSLLGKLWVKECSYRAVSVLRADGEFTISLTDDKATVEIEDLLVVREEGIARVDLDVDLDHGTVDFSGQSAMDPKALFAIIGLFADVDLESWRFDGPVTVSANGKAGYRDISKTSFRADVMCRGMGMAKVDTEECSFIMNMNGRTNILSNIGGKLYGGGVNGEAKFILPEDEIGKTSYAINCSIRNAAFAPAVGAFSQSKEQFNQGTFSGDLNITGLLGEGTSASVAGKGYIRIKGGRIFRLPVFGGLSQLLAKIIPGLDVVLQQNDIKTEFVFSDGKVHTDEILIEGDLVSLKGEGDYYLDNKLRFNVQIRLLKAHTVLGKILKPLFYPVSKLFEFRLRGTVQDPKWSVFNLPGDILEKIGLKEKQKE